MGKSFKFKSAEAAEEFVKENGGEYKEIEGSHCVSYQAKSDKFFEDKASYDDCCEKAADPYEAAWEVMKCLREDISYELRYMQKAISELWDENYRHKEGHLPKLSPSQLQALISAAGADGDFEVQKKVVWASTHKGDMEFELKAD